MGFEATVKLRIKRELVAPPKDTEKAAVSGEGFFGTETQTLEAGSEASVKVRNGIVTVSWEEPDGKDTSVSFDRNDPGLITVSKGLKDAGGVIMVFEKGVRHLTVSTIDGESIDLITGCTEMNNNIMKTGVLYMKYFVEIHGFRCETTEFRMTVRKRKA
ncbi:MAG: hypothetical protein MJ137_05630 [Clostridia bacterium]|nr:hypothetical protein [Clostridia bacterium]